MRSPLQKSLLAAATSLAGFAWADPAAAQPPTGRPPPKAPAALPRVTIDPPPGTILRDGEFPIDLGSALRLAGAQNPELLLARERVAEATAVRQLAAAQILP